MPWIFREGGVNVATGIIGETLRDAMPAFSLTIFMLHLATTKQYTRGRCMMVEF